MPQVASTGGQVWLWPIFPPSDDEAVLQRPSRGVNAWLGKSTRVELHTIASTWERSKRILKRNELSSFLRAKLAYTLRGLSVHSD